MTLPQEKFIKPENNTDRMGSGLGYAEVSRMIEYLSKYVTEHSDEEHTHLQLERIVKKNPYVNKLAQTNLTTLYQSLGGETQTLDFIIDRSKLHSLKSGEYSVEIKWDSSVPYNPKDDVVDVRIKTKTGEEYSADFITLKHLDYLFEKNKRTGECLDGTYFCMPGMIVIEEITDENVRRTVDDLVQNMEAPLYFRKI